MSCIIKLKNPALMRFRHLLLMHSGMIAPRGMPFWTVNGSGCEVLVIVNFDPISTTDSPETNCCNVLIKGCLSPLVLPLAIGAGLASTGLLKVAAYCWLVSIRKWASDMICLFTSLGTTSKFKLSFSPTFIKLMLSSARKPPKTKRFLEFSSSGTLNPPFARKISWKGVV